MTSITPTSQPTTAPCQTQRFGLMDRPSGFQDQALMALASLCILCTLGLWTASIHAQTPAPSSASYPSKPLKVVVPFTPGGVTDLLGRDIAQRLSARLGQSVVVDNRAGANGNIGADFVAKSKADGYTLLVTAANIAISEASQKKLPYHLFEDLTPITLLAKGPYIW